MKTIAISIFFAFFALSSFAQPVVSSVVYVDGEKQFYFFDSTGSKYSAVKLADSKWSPVYGLSAWTKNIPFTATNEMLYVPTENQYYIFDITGTKYVAVKGGTFEVSAKTYNLKQFATNIPFDSISAAIYVAPENQYYFFDGSGTKYIAIKGGTFTSDGKVYDLKQFAAIPFARIVAAVYVAAENQYYFFSPEGKYVAVKGGTFAVSGVYSVSQFAPGGPNF